jgi:hypothetical protein
MAGVGNFVPPPGPNTVITFLDHSREGCIVPVPNPKYLELRGAVARILHLSGADQAIDAIMDKFKQLEGPRSYQKYRTGYAFKALLSSLLLMACVPAACKPTVMS